MVIVPRASTHLEYTDIAYALPASRYGQDVTSDYVQAWLDRYLKHQPHAAAGNALPLPGAGGTGNWDDGRARPGEAAELLLLLRLLTRRDG